MSLSKAVIAEIDNGKDLLGSYLTSIFHSKNKSNWKNSLPTVMLLHGYIVSAPSLKGLTNHLNKTDFNTSCENYRFWKNLDTIESEVGDRLDQICQKVGDRIKIVGHSQGGLLACTLAQKYPDKVSKMISLGTPFGGTYIAYLNYFVPGAREMLPGSAYLKKIQETDFPERVQFVSVYSPYDEVVLMKGSSKLPEQKNIKNICAADVGHGGLIGKNCYLLIEALLRS